MSKMGQHIQEFNDDLVNMSFHEFSLKHAWEYPEAYRTKNEDKLNEIMAEYEAMLDDLLIELRTVTN